MRRAIFTQDDLAAIHKARAERDAAGVCPTCNDMADEDRPCPECGRGGFGPFDERETP